MGSWGGDNMFKNPWNTNNSNTAASREGYSCISSVTPGESLYSTTAITMRPVISQFTNHLQYPIALWTTCWLIAFWLKWQTQKRSQNGQTCRRSDPAASQLRHRSAAQSIAQEDGSHFRCVNKMAQSKLWLRRLSVDTDPAASQLRHRSAAQSTAQEDGSHFRRVSKMAQKQTLASVACLSTSD